MRANPMPLYTDLRDLYANPKAHHAGFGYKTREDEKTYYDRVSKIVEEVVPFDFSHVGDEVISLFLSYEKDPDSVAQASQFLAWLKSLPPSLPPYEMIATELVTERLTALRRSLAIITTLPTEDGYESSFEFFVRLVDNNDKRAAVLGPIADGLARFDASGTLRTIPSENFPGVILPDIHISAASIDVLKQVFLNAGIGWSPDAPNLTLEDEARAVQDTIYMSGLSVMAYTLFGCSLLHCKNVEERDERLIRQTARQRQRDGLPEIVWKTLVVRPMRRPTTPSEVADTLDTKAKKKLHGVRGHFAAYGPEYGTGKLFGKHTGVYWIPGHWRGIADVGTVVKTYDVRP